MNALLILATWAQLACSAPPDATGLRLEAQRGSLLDGWAAAKTYNTPTPADSLVYFPPEGDSLRFWVSVTTSASVPYGWRRGGQAFRVRARTPEGVAGGWSNYVCVAAGVSDTLFTDGRLWARPVGGVVRFVRAWSDMALDIYEGPGPIDSFEGAMLRGNWQRYICTWSPVWALKGAVRWCP